MTDTSIRPAAVAGLFYTAEPGALRNQVDSYLDNSGAFTWQPKAIITPHAGFIYSGPTAGVAWACAAQRKDRIKRVLLLGPNHRVPLRGTATSPAGYWQTPLGAIALDVNGAKELQSLPFIQPVEIAHAREHCLEVQVPFIQVLFPEAQLLPLLVGETTPQQVADVLRRYWNDASTLIVVSSDLSHYHDYQTARQLDRDTSRHIEHCEIAHIGPEQACGCRAICGLLYLAAEKHALISTLDLCNSGDTAGDRLRVVGYGAYAVH